jgi:glycosyltransferase involved in cell wall biosynthesis
VTHAPRREAEALLQAGAEVDVISLEQDADQPRRAVHNGIKILRVPLKHWRGGKLSYVFQYGSFILASFFILTTRLLRGRRYHLVHVHNMPDILVFSALMPRLFGAKVILDLHDPMPELMISIFGLKQESFSVQTAHAVGAVEHRLCPSRPDADLAFQKLFVARSCPIRKLSVVMNSPDEKIFEFRELTAPVVETRESSKPYVLMFHGALVERHGLDIAVQAFKSFLRVVPNAELRIYGRRTPFLDQVMNVVRELRLADSVKYLGAMPLEEIVKAIDECDIGIIPNRRSAFTEINMPTRIFEYLARAKPVIAPKTIGIRDYFKDDEIIFFEADHVEDLQGKMEYAFHKPREVHEVVRKGQAVYREHRWLVERTQFVQSVAGLVVRKTQRPPGSGETQ